MRRQLPPLHRYYQLLADAQRFRRATVGGAWEDWMAFEETHIWTLTTGASSKTVEAQVRDWTGNVSATASDSVTLDVAPPECTSFRINVGEDYVLPQEDLTFEVYGSDNLGGSGGGGGAGGGW